MPCYSRAEGHDLHRRPAWQYDSRVVSGQYNIIDEWLAHTVWVARTEDLAARLDGIAAVASAAVTTAGSPRRAALIGPRLRRKS